MEQFVSILLVILSFMLIIVGAFGAILPVLPGPPIAFLGMLVFHYSADSHYFNTSTLVLFGITAVLITVLDNVIPVIGTKKLGGSRYGTIGSTIGLVVSVLVLPLLGIVLGPFGILGIILGPFVGAYLGERYGGKDHTIALKSGLGSFLGFLAGTLLKLSFAIVVTIQCIIKMV